MKKILFVINTMGRAGAEVALIALLERLAARGDCELSLYSLIPRGEMFARLPPQVKVLNKKVSPGSVLSSGGRLFIARRVAASFFYRFTGFRLLPYFLRNFSAQKAAGRFQPDKLIWRLLSEGTPALRGGWDLGVAYIEGAATYFLADKIKADKKASFVHIDYERAGYLPIMDRDSYTRIDRVFAVSNEVQKKFVQIHPECADKTFLFRNIINTWGIRERAQQGPAFTDAYSGYRLLTIGRLTYQKGYDIAVDAFALLRKRGVDARWYIIGEGPERLAIERLIKEHGVEGGFVLLGERDNPYPYLKACDLYVHATRFEGKSVAVEEAQVLGKPILASDCTGNREQVIPGVDGILFELTAQNLAHELEKLLGDPALRERLAREVARKNLDHPEDLDLLLGLMDDEEERA